MNIAQKITHHQAQAHSTEACVGAIVWADAELGDAKFRRDEVRAKLLENGLDPALQPQDPTPQAAFGMALARGKLADGWKIEREEPRSRKALLFRLTGKGTTRIDRAEVMLTAGAQQIDTEPARSQLAQQQVDALAGIDAEYTSQLTYLAAHEIQELLRTALKTWGATRIRPHSGTYYIPARSIDQAKRLAKTLEVLGGTRVVVLPLFDGQSKLIADDLADGFERERKAVLVSLGRMVEYREGKVKPSTFESRIEELREIEARVSIVRDVLGARADELARKLARARDELRNAIAGDPMEWAAALEAV